MTRMLAAASISIFGPVKAPENSQRAPFILINRSRNEAGGSLIQINIQLTAFFITASPLADARPGFGVFHLARKRAAICCNSASSSRGSIPSASMTALTCGARFSIALNDVRFWSKADIQCRMGRRPAERLRPYGHVVRSFNA